jgi:hypothetical protein
LADDYESWIDHVQQWRDATTHVPSLVREDILKGKYRPKSPSVGIRSLMEDPLSIQYSLGYKDRKYSLTYDVLKQTVQNLSILSAIIQTRTNQVSSFAVPYRSSKSLGYVVKHKDPGKRTTKGEREMIKDLEKFIYNCGADRPNPHNKDFVRDDFETFLKKVVRDSLIYDQCTFEVVPDRKGQPYEFMAVDAGTIRIAAQQQAFGPNNTWFNRPPAANNKHIVTALNDPYSTMRMYSQDANKRPAFVQIVNGQIENVYTREELAFGVRNPRTDIYIQGYGYGEIEQLITIITAHLYAEEYNRRFFMQGSAPKGILNLKGDSMTPDQLEGFRRQWRANLEGVENAWRTPILQSEQGVDWINLNPTNREMEYGQWMEYLIKVTCGVFLIDPAELNFDLSGGVQQTPLFESSSEWKLKASRDRGLRPLLRFIAKMINDNIISKIDDHYAFDFVGLDELTEQEKHELNKEQVASYMTLNEIRRALDLPDVDGGDMILNPTFVQALQVRQQMEQQAQQMQATQSGQPPAGEAGQEGEEEEEDQDNAPEYADTFTKAYQARPRSEDMLQIEIGDEYDEWLDVWRWGKS